MTTIPVIPAALNTLEDAAQYLWKAVRFKFTSDEVRAMGPKPAGTDVSLSFWLEASDGSRLAVIVTGKTEVVDAVVAGTFTMPAKNPRRGRISAETASAEFLKTSEVAVLLGVSQKTVSMWAATGHIPAVRTPGGRSWIVPRSAVDALLEGRTITQPAE